MSLFSRVRSVRRAPAGVTVGLAVGGLVATTLAATTLGLTNSPQAAAADWQACLDGPQDRQAAFERASQISGVPVEVLLGVSFMQSRWDDHGASPSTSGGYGPMHLTAVATGAAHADPLGKGEDDHVAPAQTPKTRTSTMGADVLRTLDTAQRLTGFDRDQLTHDDVANICGGAAVLADYQARAGGADDLADWSAAVARYSGASDEPTALRFARQVFTVISQGKARTTNDGEALQLDAVPSARVDRDRVADLDLVQPSDEGVDCPRSLGCESLPAPYEWYGEPEPGAYGNHDLANRPKDLDIDYIVIHDTEATWDRTLSLVTTPDYLAWNYSLRSVDGHIAQHLDPKNVGWHAGNWYVNMHSIGLEHEGFAADGASWYTESLYRNSARLVRHLAKRHHVPLDRAHILGHDQVPGTVPATVKGMHWDPGPYWDWEHYMKLLGAPVGGKTHKAGDKHGSKPRKGQLVTVAPGFDDNQQPVTGCNDDGTCPDQGTNFVYLHQEPSADSPLVADEGLRPGESASTTHVSDIGARAAAGHRFRVAERSGDWTGVWYLGEIGWIHNPKQEPVLVPGKGKVVVPRGESDVPVYGRAYPEESAYPEEIPYQQVEALQYTLKAGQAYVLADRRPETDYYYAKTFDCAHVDRDCTEVTGKDRYYEIWFGHRMAFVRAADVRIRPN